MKPISWVGILSIVLGALVLAYQGINYTRQKQVLDLGSVHLTTEIHERIPLSPTLGGLATDFHNDRDRTDEERPH
jgi:hypothetical protein